MIIRCRKEGRQAWPTMHNDGLPNYDYEGWPEWKRSGTEGTPSTRGTSVACVKRSQGRRTMIQLQPYLWPKKTRLHIVAYLLTYVKRRGTKLFQIQKGHQLKDRSRRARKEDRKEGCVYRPQTVPTISGSRKWHALSRDETDWIITGR